jgi:hypothetical protein
MPMNKHTILFDRIKYAPFDMDTRLLLADMVHYQINNIRFLFSDKELAQRYQVKSGVIERILKELRDREIIICYMVSKPGGMKSKRGRLVRIKDLSRWIPDDYPVNIDHTIDSEAQAEQEERNLRKNQKSGFLKNKETTSAAVHPEKKEKKPTASRIPKNKETTTVSTEPLPIGFKKRYVKTDPTQSDEGFQMFLDDYNRIAAIAEKQNPTAKDFEQYVGYSTDSAYIDDAMIAAIWDRMDTYERNHVDRPTEIKARKYLLPAT